MIFLTALSFVLAAFLEWTAGPVFSFWGVSFPAVLSAAIFWFWRMELSSRVFLGILAGIFMDTVSAYPPGTYLILFFVAAFLTEVLRRFFSETEFYITKGISMAILLFICINLINPLANIMSGNGIGLGSFPFSWFMTILVASIFWAVAVPLLLFGAGRLVRGI